MRVETSSADARTCRIWQEWTLTRRLIDRAHMSAHTHLKTFMSPDHQHRVGVERGRGRHPYHVHCSCGDYCCYVSGPAGAAKAAKTHIRMVMAPTGTRLPWMAGRVSR